VSAYEALFFELAILDDLIDEKEISPCVAFSKASGATENAVWNSSKTIRRRLSCDKMARYLI